MIDSRAALSVIKMFLKKHPVRAEKTGERNLDFSSWLRNNCRPSKRGCRLGVIELGCLVAFDVDFVLYDYEREMVQLLEVKTRNGKLTYAQMQTLNMLDACMKAGAHLAGYRYLGLHTLRMDGTTPSNSARIEWDGEVVNREMCWRRINMLEALETDA